MVLVVLAVVLPVLVLVAAVGSRRTTGIPIAILGTAVGFWIFFAATHPLPGEGSPEGYPLSFYEDLGYRIERSYGAILIALFGVTLVARCARAILDARKPWPDGSNDHDHGAVARHANLPRASLESAKGKLE